MPKACKKCGAECPTARARYCDRCRPSKHRARSVVVFGKRFSSSKEAGRYGELLGLLEAGRITRLACQPRYPITINGHLVCSYVADFSYISEDGKEVIEDVKSTWTAKMPLYRLKKKLFEAATGKRIIEVLR